MKKWKLKHKGNMETQTKNNKNTIIALLAIAVIVIGSFWIITILTKNDSSTKSADQAMSQAPVNNVSTKDGKQIIEITAKAGYSPKSSIAKAGVPTILKFKTNGTYDCSSALRLPSLNISKNLPGTGETEIDIGTPGAGKFAGTCSMGMYFFEIDFQS